MVKLLGTFLILFIVESPIKYLSTGTQHVIEEWIAVMPVESVVNMMITIISTLTVITEAEQRKPAPPTKYTSGVGYRMLLQIIVRRCPLCFTLAELRLQNLYFSPETQVGIAKAAIHTVV